MKLLTPLLVGWTMLFSVGGIAQNIGNVNKIYSPNNKELQRKEIIIPKIGPYTVLKGDFHIHTMFSDGLVWPTYRIDEAWSDGLDVLAITDHIEYRPYKQYLPDDLNVSYDIALPRAKELGITLIKGIEITRKQGVLGHFNALFIKDANKIKIDDAKASITEAYNQGAYIIFNHPGWAVDTCVITPFQDDLLKSGMIKGIEVINNHEYYPRVLSWSQDMGLTVISASDSHEPIIESYDLLEDNRMAPRFRPMTLLFVHDKEYAAACALQGEEADAAKQQCIRKSLDNGTTLGYFNGNLAGKKELLEQFAHSTLAFAKIYSNGKKDFYEISNKCDIPYTLNFLKKTYVINPLSKISVALPIGVKKLDVKILNMHCYEFSNLGTSFVLP
ncbi:MAG: PHP domain-containing protein [Bacteroidales bacterium]